MDELNEEYTLLFNGITDTIRQLERTIVRLQVLQQKAEETYVERRQMLEDLERPGSSSAGADGGRQGRPPGEPMA